MRKPRSVLSHPSMAIQLLLLALLAGFSATKARAADWRVSGVYAYEANDWDARVGRHLPLVIFRYYAGRPVEQQVAEIQKLTESGNRVIVDFEFMRNIRQRRSQEPLPPFDISRAKLLAMLDGLEGIQVEAISLDEENRLSEVRIGYLNRLYRAAKRHSPHRNFVQWIAFGENDRDAFQMIDSIDTDGWIIDPYLSSEKDYQKIVIALKKVSKPIYSVIWAAPGWKVGAGHRVRAHPDWWNGSQWRIFYNRLAVNQQHDISTIFYLYGLEREKVWSLWVGKRCDRQFFSALVNIALPYYRKNRLSLRTPDARPEWIPAYCEQ